MEEDKLRPSMAISKDLEFSFTVVNRAWPKALKER
jgi:hypothetical protein